MNMFRISLLCLVLLAGCEKEQPASMVGTLERDRIDLVVESNEPIIEISVADGQAVEPGDVVLVQDPARAQARLASVTADREQAAARLAELRRGPRPELIREARARLDASEVQQRNAQSTLKRTREVHDRGLASDQQLDRDETQYQTAIAEVSANRESLERLMNGTTIEELRQAESALESRQAQVRQAQLDLERTRVVAPVRGVVDKVLYRMGERPAPGTTIAVVLDSARTYARIYVPEYLRTRIQPGSEMVIRVDGNDKIFPGRVRWVSADASFTPYFALTEHDRSRLSYLAEVDIESASQLPSGVPLVAELHGSSQ